LGICMEEKKPWWEQEEHLGSEYEWMRGDGSVPRRGTMATYAPNIVQCGLFFSEEALLCIQITLGRRFREPVLDLCSSASALSSLCSPVV
jgi:hypothetical protein